MNKSAIRDIFNGVRGSEEMIEQAEAEQKLYAVVSDTYDELVKELSPNQLKLLETFCEARECACGEDIDQIYAEGFKLGLHLGVECMDF